MEQSGIGAELQLRLIRGPVVPTLIPFALRHPGRPDEGSRRMASRDDGAATLRQVADRVHELAHGDALARWRAMVNDYLARVSQYTLRHSKHKHAGLIHAADGSFLQAVRVETPGPTDPHADDGWLPHDYALLAALHDLRHGDSPRSGGRAIITRENFAESLGQPNRTKSRTPAERERTQDRDRREWLWFAFADRTRPLFRSPDTLGMLAFVRACSDDDPEKLAAQVKAAFARVQADMDAQGRALLSAFDRFYKTLDATTVPAAGGGRIVGGIAHAVALSEATDVLYGELGAMSLRLLDQHGQGVAEFPPGVALLESDSPDGPYTPVPSRAIRVSAMGIGGQGADATVLAAIESAVRVAGFPPDKWNAMQAAQPGGNHQRFHAGELVSAADLAALESAAKLLRLKAPTAPPTVSVSPDLLDWLQRAAAAADSAAIDRAAERAAERVASVFGARDNGNAKPPALPARTEVVLWEGAEPNEHNVRLARTRSAYLEAHGDVVAALAALKADGNKIARRTFYNHLDALDNAIPHWRDAVQLCNEPAQMHGMRIVGTRGKSGGKAG